MVGSPAVTGPYPVSSSQMGPQCLLSAALLLAQVEPWEASQHCGRLEYWNPDNLCCGSCLQRFGPPRCPGEELELAELGGYRERGKDQSLGARFGVWVVSLKQIRQG